MNEELINQLVQRILSEPALQALLQGTGAGNRAKPDVLVLLNYVSDFERVLSAIETRWGAKYTLTILPSESVAKANPALPEGMNWITPQDALTKTDWQKIILPACSPNTLAKAALGLRDNPISELIGRGITQGQPIELVTEYLGFTAQTPKAYIELYEGYLQKVQSYGVQVYARIRDESTPIQTVEQRFVLGKGTTVTAEEPTVTKASPINQTSLYEQKTVSYEPTTTHCEPKATTQDVIRFEKKFLGDKDAYGFPEESRVLVKRLTVISPLARDTLKIRRVELCTELEREEGRR
ncbi:hypothetical protein [Desulfosporosinus sp. BICA1-9]|uniref:hypothetical protein n=1 Tax=Desulfosporosinus sp. BICA1-9 TaxID=1531958 RepID=UPI00054BBDFB|nr:hypothetical protein [Desulfosporosinus sp. BICA1-9]KJS49289.1 MAG: flavoprotein [Peptococcaceae bacterium BRH_c23]KJS81198.1 MAG: flavoprotein [Desulfosporosinus sp. BICA1-9]HBW37531.1 flavoprotein [Desulfosporosinus sp.]